MMTFFLSSCSAYMRALSNPYRQFGNVVAKSVHAVNYSSSSPTEKLKLIIYRQGKKPILSLIKSLFHGDFSSVDRNGNNALFLILSSQNNPYVFYSNYPGNKSGYMLSNAFSKLLKHKTTSKNYSVEEKKLEIEKIISMNFKNSSYILSNSEFNKIVRYIISNTKNINFKNKEGLTNLHQLVKFAPLELVKYALDFGADVNIKDNKGMTPLFYAIEHRDKSIFNLLVRHGGDVNIIDKNGNTLLHHAVSNRDNTNVVSNIIFLIKKGVNINSKNNKGDTPLHTASNFMRISAKIACGTSTPEAIELLVKNGANIKIKNKEGNTPLHVAMECFERSNKYTEASFGKAHAGIVKVLVKYGANINEKNINWKSPLEKALQNNKKNPTQKNLIIISYLKNNKWNK